MRKMAQLAAMAFLAILCAQAQTDQSALQQKLNGQFQLTQLSGDRNTVTGTGTVLRINKDGLVMYPTSSPLPPSNTYKNGRITQGGSGFGRDLAITMARGGQGTANDLAHRKFAVNELVWVLKVDVHPNDVTLRLCGAPDDGLLYYADLKIPFDKGSSPTPEQVMAKIDEVLPVQGAAPATNAETASAAAPQAQAPAPELKLPALYVNTANARDQLKLNADKSFQLQEDGQPYHGTFTEKGNSIELNINETNSTTVVTLKGNSITDTSGNTWNLRN